MKRIFIILCLITICKISYADIASVGYVDGVVASIQDSISDIETIRTGAGLGATAVQPSSLSTVAKTGSYNDLSNKPTIPTVPTTISSFTNDSGYITTSYHDSTKQDKLPNGPSDGIYKMVWNGRFKTFMFEKESDLLSCPDGQYDIGFAQCVDPSVNGVDYTEDSSTMTWGTIFSYGTVTGIASCNSTPGSTSGETTTEEFSQSSEGRYCWCKMTSPSGSRWVFCGNLTVTNKCAVLCAQRCASIGLSNAGFRSGVFSSVGQ